MKNIWEMPKGFTKEEATLEASRCLSCKNPRCETGCPTSMRIRDFIKEIKNDNLALAREIIDSCSKLPYICSIVCPHEDQCVGHCVLGIKGKPINCGALERYVTENTSSILTINKNTTKKVAIIGAGPSGVACAKELALNGATVEIFESTSYCGGVLAYGIPSYRLDRSKISIIEQELKALNVRINYNTYLKEQDILNLKKEYDNVYIATGLPNVKSLGIKNDNLEGVYDALDFLRIVNKASKYNEEKIPNLKGNAVIVGAGNVAMDAARSALRCNANVTLVYRRSRLEAPATDEEIASAVAEGVKFMFLHNPVEVLGKGKVTGVKLEVMALGEPDASNRRRPVGTNEFIDIKCDYIISAIGQNPDDIYDVKTLKTDHNYLVCDDDFKTNVDGIYAGGDIVLGAKTVVEAMVCGIKVAKKIINS